MDSSEDGQNTSKRTTKKRAPSKRTSTSSLTGIRKRATRQSASANKPEARQAVAQKPKVISPQSTDERKSPTNFSSVKARRRNKIKQTVVIILLISVGVVASAVVGLSDNGQIDVKQTIKEKKERIRANQVKESDVGSSQIKVPVQNKNIEQETIQIPGTVFSTASSEVSASTTEAATSSTYEIEENTLPDSQEEPVT